MEFFLVDSKASWMLGFACGSGFRDDWMCCVASMVVVVGVVVVVVVVDDDDDVGSVLDASLFDT